MHFRLRSVRRLLLFKTSSLVVLFLSAVHGRGASLYKTHSLASQPDTAIVVLDTLQRVRDTLSTSQAALVEQTPTLLDTATTPRVVVRQPVNRWNQFCDSLSIPWVALSAMLLPGSGQVINRDYWKLPIVYASIGGFGYLSYHYAQKYRSAQQAELPSSPEARLLYNDNLQSYRTLRNLSYIATAACYSLSVSDALISRSRDQQSPTAAMFASMLFPGLGQLYNQSYWKIPLIYTGAVLMGNSIAKNNRLVKRFDANLTALLDDDPSTVDEFKGKRSVEDLQYIRDYYQRYRDLNIILISVLYVANIIDAYVDAHLFYWNVNNDLAFNVFPTITPAPQLLLGAAPTMQLTITF